MKHSGFQPLFGGRRLAEWIRLGGRPERRVRVYFPRQQWHSYWFEHNWRTQQAKLARISLPEDPVFILGLWRSGTTALHELLAAITGWQTPQTWQCFNPSTCFLFAPSVRSKEAKRPMDQGLITSHGPQEDEFAMLLLGGESIYRAFIDPRRLPACVEALSAADPYGFERWRNFICGVAMSSSKARMLIKSPSHTFRIPLLRAAFPKAKFVWIGRHTGEVLASNVRMWTAMTNRYGLWDCSSEILSKSLRSVLVAYAGVLTQCLDEMPRESLLWIDFEQLRANPQRTLERVLGFLGYDSSHAAGTDASKIERALERIPVHQGARASLPADESVLHLETILEAARGRFGDGLSRHTTQA